MFALMWGTEAFVTAVAIGIQCPSALKGCVFKKGKGLGSVAEWLPGMQTWRLDPQHQRSGGGGVRGREEEERGEEREHKHEKSLSTEERLSLR